MMLKVLTALVLISSVSANFYLVETEGKEKFQGKSLKNWLGSKHILQITLSVS